ncbi:Fungal Zn(2)-Cys(6) binuclear cluster domain family protein [Pleurostoma richardsiae]|uniref:Fungal Zn(2)-Cys(6) binuclear cluster domain family protein n=1 Tax=Pleurostoma richardsiae TaxID=41990 RepID=A0AA38S011_9PEZI|nr:Fungal Zn(2)-Cys(6) binuclear cluster domain family protein [Pleurostoma richardsiae]
MDDYLRHLYPLIPIIHRPSFRRDLMNDRDLNDKVFLGLLLAMCAAVVGLMPSRFDAYRVWSPGPPLRFSCRGEMINYCHDRLMRLRDPQYFDKINFHKFAISYLMCISFFQLGDLNRARMMEVEAMQLGRLLHVHKISEYAELNCIEAQLRKKGFWLLFYTYVHSELQNLRREKLSFLDPISLSSMNLEELLPLEVDDEMIYEDSVLMPDQPGTTTSLTSAFIIHSRVFWAALLPTTKTRAEGDQQQQEMPCVCRRWRDLSANIAHLRGRLEELKYMLDSLPPQLLPWASGPTVSTVSRDDPQRIIDEQFAAMRANLHVTHLWLQSIIIDQLDAAVQDKSADASFIKKEYWAQREEISRQLLHLLHAIPEPDIEPNGLHLTFKVRDIAVGLLNCPYDEGHAAAKRAAEYIQQLTLILSRLDRSESPNMVNVQSWVDTDRIGQKGLTVGTSAVVAERAGYSGRGLGPVTTPVLEW